MNREQYLRKWGRTICSNFARWGEITAGMTSADALRVIQDSFRDYPDDSIAECIKMDDSKLRGQIYGKFGYTYLGIITRDVQVSAPVDVPGEYANPDMTYAQLADIIALAEAEAEAEAAETARQAAINAALAALAEGRLYIMQEDNQYKRVQ